MLQHTLMKPISFEGIGLHSGQAVRAEVRPAPEDHGIVFQRADLPGKPFIPARLDTVVRTKLATTLGVDGATVATVEHLIASLNGMGVDNALIVMDGPEVPILDGSASPFVLQIEAAGIAQQQNERRVLRVIKTVRAQDGDRWARLEPSDEFVIDCEIVFPHPMLGKQRFTYRENPQRFAVDIAPARTFGMLADVEAMQAAGLALGGGLDNAVVFGPEHVVNPGGLRFSDECARHKVLDMIGDLGLLGSPMMGRFSAHCSGHAFNLDLVNMALAEGAIVPCQPSASILSASG